MRVVDAQRLLAHEPQQRMGVSLLQDLGGDVAAPPVVPGAPDRTDPPRPMGSTSSYRPAKTSPMAVRRAPFRTGDQDSRAPPGARVLAGRVSVQL